MSKFLFVGGNVNEVIRAVLKPLFFLRKDFARTKSTKSTKSTKTTKSTKNAYKQVSDFFPLRYFFMRMETLPFLFLFAYMHFCA